MSVEIRKFVLSSQDVTVIAMPKDARILTVQNQRDRITLWASLELHARRVNRRFCVKHDDDALEGKLGFLGTVQFSGGTAGHVFEVL